MCPQLYTHPPHIPPGSVPHYVPPTPRYLTQAQPQSVQPPHFASLGSLHPKATLLTKVLGVGGGAEARGGK